jgi:long-chain fatty acid transport protein
LELMNQIVLSALLGIVALLPGTAAAGALYFPEMSNASEAGYAGAGMVARANDAGTAFSNPAGMTRFDEPEKLAGATLVYIDAGFSTNDDNTADGKSGSVNKLILPMGSLSYVRPMSDRLSFGVSVHNYFGLAFDMPDDWVGRYSTVQIALIAPQVQPAVAYKVNDWLSVGAGAAVTLGYLRDKMRVQQPLVPGDDGKLRISDADLAVQWNFGVMIQPWEHTRIGLRYLSETDLDFKDAPDISGVIVPDAAPLDFTTNADGIELGIKMPRVINTAVHHQWNEKLALLGSIGWEEFSRFGKVQVGLNDTGISTTLDADFRDVWTFGAGAEYQYKRDWELTAGASFASSYSTDRTRPISVPLGTQYRYGVGFKHTRSDDRVVGAGLTWVWGGNLPIAENSAGVAGKYSRQSIWLMSLYTRW